MSDYDSQYGGFVALPPADLLKIMILERRRDAITSIHNYYKRVENGSRGADNILVADIRALWLEIESSYLRDKKAEANHIIGLLWCNSNKADNAIRAFRLICDWLDKKSITRVDLKRSIDTSIAENENEDASL